MGLNPNFAKRLELLSSEPRSDFSYEEQLDEMKECLAEEIESKYRYAVTNTFHRAYNDGSF